MRTTPYVCLLRAFWVNMRIIRGLEMNREPSTNSELEHILQKCDPRLVDSTRTKCNRG